MPIMIPPRSHAADVRHLTSHDGTRICYSVWGEGPRTLVLAPGLATGPLTYDFIVEHFAPSMRIVTWDQRGTFRSGQPPAGGAAQRVCDTVGDLAAIIAAEKLASFVLVGWSMGVQTSLEFCVRFPRQVEALGLISGTYGRVFDTATHPAIGRVVSKLMGAVVPFGRRLDPIVKATLRHRAFLPALFATRMMHPRNKDFLAAVIDEFSGNDFGRYVPMMRALYDHTSWPYLPEITQPTLIVAGTHDLLTPMRVARRMHERMPNAQLRVVEGGTHFTLHEFPEIINEALEGLIGPRGAP
ncbi:MAG: 3-oxoadipate enol-lactonase [Myxococcota bacterium]|jgi:3-oxoadipate enol-lactonase